MGFESVTHSITFTSAVADKGKRLAKKNVIKVQEIQSDGISTISSEVIRKTSINAPAYQVKLYVNELRMIIGTECTCCVSAAESCKHIAALINYINTNRSATTTSLEQEWGAPSASHFAKEIYSEGIKISDLFPKKHVRPFVPPAVLEIDDFAGIMCPLRDILIAEKRIADERDCQLIINDLIENCVRLLEKENSEACV